MASEENFLKCACVNCGGHIEYPAHGAGSIAKCPHCRLSTRLADAPEPAKNEETPPARAASARWKSVLPFAASIGGGLIAAAAFISWSYYQNRPVSVPSAPAPVAAHNVAAFKPGSLVAEKPKTKKHAAPPLDLHGFKAREVSLEKAGDGRLVYAVGVLLNDSDHQRYGVTILLDLFDSKDEKIGTATDYTQYIDVGKEWKFRALVTDSGAVSAKVSKVTEN